MSVPPMAPPPPRSRHGNGRMSPWFYLVAALVPVGFVLAAFAGVLGPAIGLNGTVDTVALVLIDARVTISPADSAEGAAPAMLPVMDWCSQARLDGNRLIWSGGSYDTNTDVVVMITYSGLDQVGLWGGSLLIAQVQGGHEYSVAPVLKTGPELYRVLAQPTVTVVPNTASLSGDSRFDVTYNVTGLNPRMEPGWGGENMTVTEVHTTQIGYQVGVVLEQNGMCF